MDRREFLSVRNLAQSAGQVVGWVSELVPEAAPVPPRELAWLRFQHPAMATTFELVLPFGTPDALNIAEEVFACIEAVEAQLSVYREESEVSWLNRRAYDEAVIVDEELFRLLQLSLRLYHETEGAFDCAMHRLIECWGFFRGPPRIPEPGERQRSLEQSGCRWLVLDETQRSVRFLRRGVALNFGSIGKGYALDRAAEILRQRGLSGLLQGGRSSVLGIGHPPDFPQGWCVAVRHPTNPLQTLATVPLRDQALGTSAATFRHLEWAGRKLGHILDPRTGWPASGLLSATALAPTAAEADALATAFFVLGTDKVRDFCANHPAIRAILLPEDTGTPIFVP
ncbi:MAG: FAD:protein FMN transferase [Gemmatales bacterium]|nr:FAD:protein FMN transferase [Gemmatales bacterium]MDW7995817.1 FAD:protein FMN transferase [Gemmatales bacterium]